LTQDRAVGYYQVQAYLSVMEILLPAAVAILVHINDTNATINVMPHCPQYRQ